LTEVGPGGKVKLATTPEGKLGKKVGPATSVVGEKMGGKGLGKKGKEKALPGRKKADRGRRAMETL